MILKGKYTFVMYHWEKLNLNYRIIWCLVYLAGKKDFVFFYLSDSLF
jgi:hypothetical protein